MAGRAEEERLAPLLYALGRELPLPDAARARLRAAWLAFGRQHLQGVAELRALLGAFEGAGIDVIPLKGPALAEALYRDPGLRPFTDLDLLVRRQDAARAVAVLGELGYRHLGWQRSLAYELAHAPAACFVAGGGALPVDLHWGLVGFPAGTAPLAPGAEASVWERAVATERWGRRVLALAPEDLVLYLALHLAVHHPLAGLVWRLDLALLLRRHGPALDWDALVARAGAWRARGALYFALAAVEYAFAPGVPGAPLAALRPRGPRGALLDRLARRGDERGLGDHLVALLVMDRLADVGRALAAGVAPPAAWARSRYGTARAARAYTRHYARLAVAAARAAAALVRPR